MRMVKVVVSLEALMRRVNCLKFEDVKNRTVGSRSGVKGGSVYERWNDFNASAREMM